MPPSSAFDLLELEISPRAALSKGLNIFWIRRLFRIIRDSLGETLDGEVTVPADLSEIPG